MAKKNIPTTPFHTSSEEIKKIEQQAKAFHTKIPHLNLAFTDHDFLLREELRPIRLQLELLRPELILQDHGIKNTIVFFGSARIPDPEYAEEILRQAGQALMLDEESAQLKRQYKIAENIVKNSQYMKQATGLARLISSYKKTEFVVLTGGGQGFMRGANRGAHEVGKRSISLSMLLSNDKSPNEFVTPELTFQFHYFAIRKMHFLMRAKALVVFPGGFGTFDELFEALTLMQTHKIDRFPIVLFRKAFWDTVLNFDALVEQGVINEDDLSLFSYVETAEEAWEIIKDFHQLG